nr:MAG TPA: hypothetical protein [Caudoviricetes sp.]
MFIAVALDFYAAVWATSCTFYMSLSIPTYAST